MALQAAADRAAGTTSGDAPARPEKHDTSTAREQTDEIVEPVQVGFRASRFAQKEELGEWFPQILATADNNRRIWLSRRSQALCIQFIIIGVIFLVNLSLTAFAAANYDDKNGVGLIYEGNCQTVKQLDQWLHLLINLLSTGMLGASSYGMQLQAAPTRANVDEAHKAGKWLDIGAPSIRNLRYIGNWRRFAWATLALSSVPIHLIYNSAIFQSLSSTVYTVAVVKDSFIEGASWSTSTAEKNRAGDYSWDEERVNPLGINFAPVNYTQVILDIQQHTISNPDSYTDMNMSECFDHYDDYWKPQGDGVVLVTNSSLQAPADDSLLLYVMIIPRSDGWAKNMWALGNGTNKFSADDGSTPSPIPSWRLGPPHYGVARCVVREPPAAASRCRFEYSPPIMWTVCGLNFIKATVMLCIWLLRAWQSEKRSGSEREILYTLGDAISSFMQKPDPTTKDMGLATMRDFRSTRPMKARFVKQHPSPPIHPREFREKRSRWMAAASVRKWSVFLFACLTIVGVASGLLGLSVPSLHRRRLSTKIPDLWKMGFGALTPYTYLVIGLPRKDPAGLISNVLVANLPQLIVSILYMLLNTMLSTFMVQREFSKMNSRRKPLRVSEPTGIQRSSYFISLPLRYGVPYYATSGLMHWLISRSLFLARITAVLPDGSVDSENSFSTCGYSPIAIFITLLVGLGLVLTVVSVSFFKKYDGTMRLASTSSRAISAACHVLEEDRQSGHLLPVQWGVVEVRGGVGKCSFTTAPASEMQQPVEGRRYH